MEKNGIQHGGCKEMQTNPKLGQRCALPDAGQNNLTSQWLGSNCSVRKLLLLLLIFKSGENKNS